MRPQRQSSVILDALSTPESEKSLHDKLKEFGENPEKVNTYSETAQLKNVKQNKKNH